MLWRMRMEQQNLTAGLHKSSRATIQGMSSLQAPAGLQPSASYSFTMRIELRQLPGAFAQVAGAIGNEGAILGAIDLVRVDKGGVIRDVTVACVDAAHGERVVNAVRALEGVKVSSVSDRTFLMHKGGKIEVTPKIAIKTRDDLSMAYTPGVARVCSAIHEDEEAAWTLTIKGNTVAVVSDGTAVLGLGNIGPKAAMPVMEGKAMLFKELGGVDAFPICLDTTDVDEIVRIVEALAPTFGGINLEDISAPRCFEIERRLKESLDIPGLPRRPARHRGRGARGAAERAARRRQGRPRRARRHGRRRGGRPGLREDHPRARGAGPRRVRHRRHPAPGPPGAHRRAARRWPSARTRAG